MAKAKRIPLKDRTLENDIKYKAPLSYRYLRILAWFFLVLAQICMVAKINTKLIPSSYDQIGWMVTAGSYFSSLPLPIFMLANFAVIFQKKDRWKYLLTFYGGVALLLYIVGNVVIIHYGYGFINAFGEVDFMSMAQNFGFMLFSMGTSGLVFNIFIDLFLCCLLFFFMNYKPKKYFQGKNIKYFRMLVAIPILYEIASITIKYFVAVGTMPIPFFCFFLLTSKPPLMFIAFLVLVVVLKLQEIKAAKEEPDLKSLNEHRKTNAHSLRFSIIIAIVFFAAGLIDLIINIVVTIGLGIANTSDPSSDAATAAIYFASYVVDQMGFGKAFILLVVSPLALLFSYTKTHKNPKLDPLIPIVGLVLIIFVYVEGVFQIIVQNIPILMEKIREIIIGE